MSVMKRRKAFYTAAMALLTLGGSILTACSSNSLFKERINGVVMNIDRWYELYDVQWGDNLYLSPERRSYIW